MNFEAFLAASRITDEQFSCLDPVQKSQIFLTFSQLHSNAKNNQEEGKAPEAKEPEAKIDDEVHGEELDQSYHRLIHSETYRQAIENLCVLKYQRKRCFFPDKKLPPLHDDLQALLTNEMKLWLRRLYYCSTKMEESDMPPAEVKTGLIEVDDAIPTTPELIEVDDAKVDIKVDAALWTPDKLFTEAYTLNGITRLQKFMLSASTTLSAGTFIKGYNCLLYVLKAVFGKHLSSCSSESQRLAVTLVRSKLRDYASSWNSDANLVGNQLEKKRIQFALANVSAMARLKHLYTIFFTELYWYKHGFGGILTSAVNGLSRAVGFTVFSFLVGRPANRPQYLEMISLTDVVDCKIDDPNLKIVFEQHKNARRTRTPNCCVAFYPDFVVRVLHVYLQRIRPVLLTDCWTGDKGMLFPANALTFLLKFFRSLGLELTPGSIRQLFCQAVGEHNAPTHSQWSSVERRDLQICAGHGNNNSMIEKHYEVTAKTDREILLQRFLREEFFIPVRQSLLSVLLNTPKQMRMEISLRGQSQTILDWSDEDSDIKTKNVDQLVDPNWDPSETLNEPPCEIILPVRKKRAVQDEQPLSDNNKRICPTLSFSRDLKARVKTACIQLFRENYLAPDDALQIAIWAEMTKLFGPSLDIKSNESTLVFKECRKYSKGLFKNW
jgi:hypothetical protein